MKWKRLPRGTRLEDRRGSPMGGMGGLPIGVGGGGIGVLVLLAIILLTGGLPGGGGGGDGSPFDLPAATNAAPPPENDPDATLAQFSKAVFSDVDRTWQSTFERAGRGDEYRQPTLVLFTQGTTSACGGASAAVGPHYCPPDQRVYLDLSFFRELRDRFGASGDFAHAYVIAHEVGHHVQNVLKVMDRVESREDSIRLELQADCLAGVWAHTAEQRDLLESGDVQEGLDAAAAVGDDRIQQRTQGRIDPESWTHGSSEQRMKWFTRGMNAGDPGACDTFSGEL